MWSDSSIIAPTKWWFKQQKRHEKAVQTVDKAWLKHEQWWFNYSWNGFDRQESGVLDVTSLSTHFPTLVPCWEQTRIGFVSWHPQESRKISKISEDAFQNGFVWKLGRYRYPKLPLVDGGSWCIKRFSPNSSENSIHNADPSWLLLEAYPWLAGRRGSQLKLSMPFYVKLSSSYIAEVLQEIGSKQFLVIMIVNQIDLNRSK